MAAATSFHWIPPEQGLDRVARVLRPGGCVALWWNHFGDPDRSDPFREAVEADGTLGEPTRLEIVTIDKNGLILSEHSE